MFRICIAQPEEMKDIKAFLMDKQQDFYMDKLYMVSHEVGLAGVGIFSIVKDSAVIEDIILRNEQDTEMNIFMIQAIINKADYMGLRNVYCRNERLTPYLIKFKKSDLPEYSYMVDLTEYFQHSCQNQNKND